MLYSIYETQRRALQPFSQALNFVSQSMEQVEMFFPTNPAFNVVKAQTNWLSEFTKTYPKPSFNINTINLKGKIYPIKEEIVSKKGFCELIHFKKIGLDNQQPALLVVAPLSGHFATLLRDTVKQSLTDFDVYVTDWTNPADIPVEEGDFGFDDYIQYVIDFIAQLNDIHGGCDVLAVCQPTVPVLAATAYLEKHNPSQSPRSVTVMGGPIDTRRAPTEVNKYALKHDISWFKSHVIYTVPMYYKGAGRKVYPGFLQYLGFVSMNLKKHADAHIQFFNHLLEGADLNVEKHKRFYDEYNAVMDLPAKYYIETLERVFMDQHLAKGKLKFNDDYICLGDIKNVKILAIEGSKDDISGPEQTFAVLDLTPNLPDNLKKKYLAEGAGHYGVFSGKRWRESIYPEIVNFIIGNEKKEEPKSAQALKNALVVLPEARQKTKNVVNLEKQVVKDTEVNKTKEQAQNSVKKVTKVNNKKPVNSKKHSNQNIEKNKIDPENKE